MQVRLVKGPFGGKKMEVNAFTGQNEITITGPKRMTRRQRYKLMMEMENQAYPVEISTYPMTVRAIYRIAMRPQGGRMMPCMHPDGSLFYEHVPDK